MSEAKLREALQMVRDLAYIDDDGDWALSCLFDMGIVDKALAQPTEAVELTDAVNALRGLMSVESRGRVMPIGAEWDTARAVIAAHEAKRSRS